MRHLAVHVAAIEIGNPDAIRRENRHIAIGQKKHILCVGQDRGDVAGDEVFVIADADDDRRTHAGGDDFVRVGARNHGQREDAGDLLHRQAHRLFQAAFEMFLDQMRDDLGVGLGLEEMAFMLELMLQREVVLDNAVVYHHHVVLTVAVRVRVLFRGPSVSRPSRMADAERAVHRAHPDGLFQVAELSLRAPDDQFLVVAINREAWPNRSLYIRDASRLPE